MNMRCGGVFRTCALVGLVLGLGCTPWLSTTQLSNTATAVHKVQFLVANVFVIEATDGVVIVDTGDAGKHGDILAALDKLGIDRGRVKLVVITHAHGDHAGSAEKLATALSVPVAVGAGDVADAAAGRGSRLHPTSIIAGLLKLFLKHDYPAFKPDIAVRGCLDLSEYGVPGLVVETRGHTPGSLVVILPGGDAIVGDITAGGYLGGLLGPRFPTEHYMQQYPERTDAIVEWLLDYGVERLHVGHGGPLSAASIRKRQENGKFNPPEGLKFVPAPCASIRARDAASRRVR